MSKDKEDLTRQGRKLLAQLTEYMPLGEVPRDTLQVFIDGRGTSARWLAEQLRLYPHVVAKRSNIVDCSAVPFIPLGWSICSEDQIPSRFTGVLSWGASGNGVWLLGEHETSPDFRNRDFYKGFLGFTPLPANVLDWLLVNSEQIPLSWNAVFFPGTVYRTEKGQRAVRFLVRTSSGPSWNYLCLTEKNFSTFLPAACMPKII